jgi:type I restriction-modification system DNA methylase subunit
MQSITAHKIKNRKEPKDVFYTPIDLVKKHLSLIKPYVNDNDKILDPFFGNGAYFNLFKDYFVNNTFDYTEITLNKDFFNYNTSVDIIVSNPPYSILNKVLEQSIKLKPKVISYLIAVHNLTTKRIEYMNQNGYILKKVCILKVNKWFGMSCIVIFVKENGNNCIDFDRTIYY